jgi:hypothetical protein
VFCPSCGAENEEGSRYCASCGRPLLREAPAPKAGDSPDSDGGAATGGGPGGAKGGFTDALDGIIGTTRQARLVSAGIAAALIVAVVAFIALGSDKETTIPQDGLTKAMDAACVHRKVEIAKAQAEALNGADLAAVTRYADSVVKVTGAWRLELGRLDPPEDRAASIEGLREALLEVQLESGALARSAREADKPEVAARAGRVEAATANVEEAIQSLELERCGRLIFGSGHLVRE